MPPVPVIVVELPMHIAAAPTVVATVGNAFTVMAFVPVVTQVPVVPVTVYVLVAVVEQVTVVPVVALRPVAGDHV